MYVYYRNAEFCIRQSGYGQWEIRATFNGRADKIVSMHWTNARLIDDLTDESERVRRGAAKRLHIVFAGAYRGYYGRIRPRAGGERGYVVNGVDMTGNNRFKK